MSEIYREEAGFLDLVGDILDNGVEVPDRTGVGSIAVFDRKLIFNNAQTFPFSTCRVAGLRLAFEEFWFFLRGETQTKILESKGITFWQGNTSRDFLVKRGLSHLLEGDMGKAYGYQFRNYGGSGFDQLVDTYNTLKKDPFSRRVYNTFWNPAQSNEMALTPCWHSHQFVVLPDKETGENVLNLKLINRSLDVVFGCMFAIQQYALYQRCMAELLGFKVGVLSCDLSQAHIYNNQITYARELRQRTLGLPGEIIIKKPLESLDDLLSMSWDDIEVVGLIVNNQPFKTPRPPMAV